MAERERLERGKDERYIRRDDQGRFTQDQTDVGRSARIDQQHDAKKPARRGQGDQGDRSSTKR